jgi:hypothetical protein
VTLTVACLWVKGKGKRAYTVEYVERLRSMVQRNLDRPFRMVCLTDRPDLLPEGIEAVEVSRQKKVRPWWLKTKLFSPDMPFTGRVLYLDLDVLVTGDLSPIVDYPAEFAICPDSAPGFTGAHGRVTVKGYNSSVMVWDAGVRPEIHTDLKPVTKAALWSDQDWIRQRFPNEKTFPAAWFRRLSAGPPPWPAETKVVLCIKIKNAEAATLYPWFEPLWR